jgi:hypothetical protein
VNDAPPQVIADRYRLVRELTPGSAAAIWLANDSRTELRVVVKIFPALRTSIEEFRREAAVGMRAQHANLSHLLDAGVQDGIPWLAMQYAEGVDVRCILGAGPLAVDEAIRVMSHVFSALDALHAVGTAHGDIKPENVVLVGQQAVVIDYGRGRLLHLFEGQGTYPGTPPYMHPALYRGGAPTAATDCFAAWVMLHELVGGARPWSVGALRKAPLGTVPPRPALGNAALDLVLDAGARGDLCDARQCWLALARLARGARGMPRLRRPAPGPHPGSVSQLLLRLAAGRSAALVGEPDPGRTTLEEVHRRWEGPAIWLSADWGQPAEPLSGAIALAGHAADGLATEHLNAIARALGPLGGAIAEVAPAARAWLQQAPATGDRPPAERLALAIRRFLLAAPQPLALFVDGLDRLDGSSRRLLGTLANAHELSVVGTAAPGRPHGLGEEVALPEFGEATLLPDPDPLVARARLLQVPFGPELARLAGVSEEEVQRVAIEAESIGSARWDGKQVWPRGAGAVRLDQAGVWYREAARATADPLQAALWAMEADDGERLAEVADEAIRLTAARDPEAALAIARADPRPADAARTMRVFHLAIQAREMGFARSRLDVLRSLPEVAPADLAEAEGELAFRQGHGPEAVLAFRRAAAGLGHPIAAGWRGALQDVVAFARLLLRRPPRARPDARLARIYERLHDLYFSSDHGPMLRMHQLCRQAAPEQLRARAMQVVWLTAIGRGGESRTLENAMVASVDEHADPLGAAIVLQHRSIARSLRGETRDAFGDAVDASERLLRVGDPYLGALATTAAGATALHLGTVEPMDRIVRELEALVRVTGDERARAWALGGAALVRWLRGDRSGSMAVTRAWAEDARQRRDMSEVVARRLVAEMALEGGDWEVALTELDASLPLIARYHLRLDLTDAWIVPWVIADAQARLAGSPGRRPARGQLDRLGRRYPHWLPRAGIARAWAQRAGGDPAGASSLFEQAHALAVARDQPQDAWLALVHAGLAMQEPHWRARASDFAVTHGLAVGEAPHRRDEGEPVESGTTSPPPHP